MQELQLLDIRVVHYDDASEFDSNTGVTYADPINQSGTRTITLADGSKATSPWDPIRFELQHPDGESLSPHDIFPDREGTQVRVYIDVSAAGLAAGTFTGYIKYVSAESLSQAGGTLYDLDGKPITQAGWYDFTQRTPGGDGARIVTQNGKIVGIELIITDNQFGDDNMAVDRILDPGTPVLLQNPASALFLEQSRLSDQAPPLSPARIVDDFSRPHAPLDFDSSLYPLTAKTTVQDQPLLTEPVFSDVMPLTENLGTYGSQPSWMAAGLDMDSTANGHWDITLLPASEARLVVFRGMPDQYIEAECNAQFEVPRDIFACTQGSAGVQLLALLADGRKLPDWIVFDSKRGVFTVKPPLGQKGDLAIRLVARDSQGREASTLFRLRVGEKYAQARTSDAPEKIGRSCLTDKIRLASKQRPAGVGAEIQAVTPLRHAEPTPARVALAN